jgi:hypothetical protein
LLVAGISVAAGLYVVWLRKPHPESLSDLRQILVGAQAWLRGVNPYEAVRAWGQWPFPLLYPFTAVLLVTPLAVLPPWSADAIFVSVSCAVLGWALTSRGISSPKLLVFASAPFIHATVLDQWSPLLTGGALIPWLGFLLVCKPNIGLALFAAFPSARSAATAAGMIGLSILLWPTWLWDWRSALRDAPNSLVLLTLPGGVLLLLALLRWRRPEARLLLALACIPQTTLPYEALPLFLVVESWTEAAILWAGTGMALLAHAQGGPYDSQLAWVRAAGIWHLYCAYLPCLLAVLRRPNLAPSPRPQHLTK